VVANHGKDPGIRPPGQRAKELNEGAVEDSRVDLVTPLAVELHRGQENGANHKGDQQPTGALVHVLAGSAPPQGKPRAGAGNQEEQWHSPRKEEGLDAGYDLALVGVLDDEILVVKDVAGMKEKDTQDCQHTQPIKVVQAPCFGSGAVRW